MVDCGSARWPRVMLLVLLQFSRAEKTQHSLKRNSSKYSPSAKQPARPNNPFPLDGSVFIG